MGFNEFLSSIFGNKSTRDMKEIQPWVDKIKAAYPEVEKLDNDGLRAKTQELKQYIYNSATQERAKVEELKASIESIELEDREEVFAQIDKLEKEILEIYEKALEEVLPVAFSIVKDTARRFTENEEIVVTATDFDRTLAATKDFVRIEGDKAIYQNHWNAGGNDTIWNMIHYDVQLFGGVVLHKGKIAEMATGEGKTLVATLPVFLNALTGNGVHVVTVNDYLAKRDSEWMGPLYMFHGLSVDCIDRHQPNSDARRQAYLADITFGTNNEFGFDSCRKVRCFDIVHQLFYGNLGIIKICITSIDNLGQVVRWHIRSHTYSNTGSAIYQKIRDTCRHYSWFHQRIVEVRFEVNGFFIKILHHSFAELVQSGLCITHSCGTVTIHRTKVTLAIY